MYTDVSLLTSLVLYHLYQLMIWFSFRIQLGFKDWCRKKETKRNSKTLLCLVSFFLHQSLQHSLTAWLSPNLAQTLADITSFVHCTVLRKTFSGKIFYSLHCDFHEVPALFAWEFFFDKTLVLEMKICSALVWHFISQFSHGLVIWKSLVIVTMGPKSF